MSFKGHQSISGIDYTLGAEVITDTAAHTGRFNHIDFYENTHINTIISTNMTGNTLNGETFPAGSEIHGLFTRIQLQSGACIAYKV
jgi:hypothetical protein